MPLSAARRVRRDDDGAAHLDGAGRGAGAGLRRRRSTRCACSSIRRRSPISKIGIDEVASAISAQNVSLPTGVLWGPNKAYTVQANGQLQNAAAFRELVVTYRNGAPVHLGEIGQVLDDVQNNQRRQLVQRRARRSCSACSGSRARNTVAVANGGERRSCNRCGSQIPASVAAADALRPLDLDRGIGARREVHAAADAGARRDGDLPLPAQRVGDADPEPRAADLDRRHVRGDVSARTTASTTCR